MGAVLWFVGVFYLRRYGSSSYFFPSNLLLWFSYLELRIASLWVLAGFLLLGVASVWVFYFLFYFCCFGVVVDS